MPASVKTQWAREVLPQLGTSQIPQFKSDNVFENVRDASQLLDVVGPRVADNSILFHQRSARYEPAFRKLQDVIDKLHVSWSAKDKTGKYTMGFGDRADIVGFIDKLQSSRYWQPNGGWGAIRDKTRHNLADIVKRVDQYSTEITLHPPVVINPTSLESRMDSRQGRNTIQKINNLQTYYDGQAEHLPGWIPDETKIISNALQVSQDVSRARLDETAIPFARVQKVVQDLNLQFKDIWRPGHRLNKLFAPLYEISQSVKTVQAGTKRLAFARPEASVRRKDKRSKAGGLVAPKLPKKLDPATWGVEEIITRVKKLDQKALARYKKQLERKLRHTPDADLQVVLKKVSQRIGSKGAFRSKISKLR